jgi:hypothetical protein
MRIFNAVVLTLFLEACMTSAFALQTGSNSSIQFNQNGTQNGASIPYPGGIVYSSTGQPTSPALAIPPQAATSADIANVLYGSAAYHPFSVLPNSPNAGSANAVNGGSSAYTIVNVTQHPGGVAEIVVSPGGGWFPNESIQITGNQYWSGSYTISSTPSLPTTTSFYITSSVITTGTVGYGGYVVTSAMSGVTEPSWFMSNVGGIRDLAAFNTYPQGSPDSADDSGFANAQMDWMLNAGAGAPLYTSSPWYNWTGSFNDSGTKPEIYPGVEGPYGNAQDLTYAQWIANCLTPTDQATNKNNCMYTANYYGWESGGFHVSHHNFGLETFIGSTGASTAAAGSVVSGTYVSGLTPTGAAGTACSLTFNNGSTATAYVTLSGTNYISPNTPITIQSAGSSATAAPTSATATPYLGTTPPYPATSCSDSTATVVTTLATNYQQHAANNSQADVFEYIYTDMPWAAGSQNLDGFRIKFQDLTGGYNYDVQNNLNPFEMDVTAPTMHQGGGYYNLNVYSPAPGDNFAWEAVINGGGVNNGSDQGTALLKGGVGEPQTSFIATVGSAAASSVGDGRIILGGATNEPLVPINANLTTGAVGGAKDSSADTVYTLDTTHAYSTGQIASITQQTTVTYNDMTTGTLPSNMGIAEFSPTSTAQWGSPPLSLSSSYALTYFTQPTPGSNQINPTTGMYPDYSYNCQTTATWSYANNPPTGGVNPYVGAQGALPMCVQVASTTGFHQYDSIRVFGPYCASDAYIVQVVSSNELILSGLSCSYIAGAGYSVIADGPGAGLAIAMQVDSQWGPGLWFPGLWFDGTNLFAAVFAAKGSNEYTGLASASTSGNVSAVLSPTYTPNLSGVLDSGSFTVTDQGNYMAGQAFQPIVIAQGTCSGNYILDSGHVLF